MFLKSTAVLASFVCCSFSLSALAAIQVGDHGSYDTKSKLVMEGDNTEEHFLVTDTVKTIGDDGIHFEETRKTDTATTSEMVTYTEAAWLMLASDGPQTGDEALKQCGTFKDSKKVTVTLKSGTVDGCEVTSQDDSYHLRVVYAPVPLYVYTLEYHDADEDNQFDLSQQYIEER